MDPRRRKELARYGAPAAFLAAVTIAVILIKSGLSGGSGSTTTVGLFPTTTRTATTTTATTTKLVLTTPQASTATTTETTTPGAEYYAVKSGDTLGSIAQKYGTTVDELMALNPGIDPTALLIGQKLRVK
ncbi:MAG TPA: LysM domain-containing protein [Gaiellaceae bacterium]